jgi:hypothetical protein
MPSTNTLVLVGLLFYVVASLLLWRFLLTEPTPGEPHRGRPRWTVRLAKAAVTLVGGAAVGAAALLVVATIVNAGKPGTMTTHAMLAVWAVTGVAAILFVGRALLIRGVVTRTCLAVGVLGVALPAATLLAFAVAGTRLAGSAGTGGERTVEVLGVRLVGSLPAIWVALGGFCVGLALIVVGDRAQRPAAKRGDRRRSRSSRAGVISARARH